MTRQEEKFENHYMNCDVCGWQAKSVVMLKDMVASKLCRIGRRMFIALFGLMLFCLTAFAQCGVERNSVKDLKDGFTVPPASNNTVTALRQLAPPSKVTNTLPRQPEERRSFLLSSWLLGYKLEADQDYHVVISEVGHPELSMVVEIPSPLCVRDPHLMATFIKERQFIDSIAGIASPKFKTLKTPVPIAISGVLFFDKIHGQKGVAPNGVELHPVLSVEKRPLTLIHVHAK